MNPSTIAKNLFLETLGRLGVEEALRARASCAEEVLRVGELAYDLRDFDRVLAVSVGKAATPMCEALLPILEPGLKRGQAVEAVVVGATRPRAEDARVRFFAGSHPFPDQASREAARATLKLLASADERTLVIFLVSGGASAMVEEPLDGVASVEEASRFYRALVRSGLPIGKMNALRKHFSRVKGGRMAVAAQRATQCTLLISDAPADQLHIVGSGPSLPDPSTAEECRGIIRDNRSHLDFSDELFAFFSDPELEETPKPHHPAFARSEWISLLSSEDLCRAAGELAAKMGCEVVIDNRCDEWDYREAAAYLLERMRELRTSGSRVCLLSAGEISVKLPLRHGIGGRNQQFALECARMLAGSGMRCSALSGGSDGVDGNSPAAGAVCDETTMERAASMGLEPLRALEAFDSHSIFEALGDTIATGPTGNNVRDLRILISGD